MLHIGVVQANYRKPDTDIAFELPDEESKELYKLNAKFWKHGNIEKSDDTKDENKGDEGDDDDDEERIAKQYKYDTIKLILNDPKFDSINAVDKYKTTALGWACYEGDLDIIKLLCERKDIRHDMYGKTSPFAMASNCNLPVLKYLKERFPNLDVNGKDESQRTALIKACEDCDNVDSDAGYTSKDCIEWYGCFSTFLCSFSVFLMCF